MNKQVIFALFLFLTSGLSQANVTVEVNGEQRNYTQPPRLTEVLQPYALQQQWYWPAAALYRLNSQRAENIRRELVALADEIGQQTHDKALRESLALLQAQVTQWQLAERIVVPIDYDAATVQMALNPRLDSGSYRLLLKRRPVDVHLIGAVKREFSVPHNGARHVAVYIQSEQFSPCADHSRVVIVQPDGQLIVAGIDSWNSQHIEAMPGAQLLVLFSEPMLDKRFATLNHLLQQLAVHRILP